MLIGLNGKKQAGKDTVFERLVRRLPDYPVERVSFADKLYESAAAALGVTADQLRDWKVDDRYRVQAAFDDGARRWTYGNLSVRQYLQGYGTEAHRDVFGSNFWVDNVDLSHEGKVVVVTDVRFANEAQAVSDAGGVVVNVQGPPEVENAGDGHASELPLPGALIDHHIDNSVRGDGFESLDTQVLALVIRLSREERP